MTRIVTFIDTSILLEILRVPGKHQQSEATVDELRARAGAGETMMLPAASIIETGNHIAQLGDGEHRRAAAERFAKVLRATVNGSQPWAMNGARWDDAFLISICDGAHGCLPFPDMAAQSIGAGDVSILAEAEAYANRVSHVTVRIWTLDESLEAWT